MTETTPGRPPWFDHFLEFMMDTDGIGGQHFCDLLWLHPLVWSKCLQISCKVARPLPLLSRMSGTLTEHLSGTLVPCVMGPAVLVLWYFGSPCHGVCSFGTLVLWFPVSWDLQFWYFGYFSKTKLKESKSPQTPWPDLSHSGT